MLSALLSAHPQLHVANDSLIYHQFGLAYYKRIAPPALAGLRKRARSLHARFSDGARIGLYRVPFERLPPGHAKIGPREFSIYKAKLLERYQVVDQDTELDERSWMQAYSEAVATLTYEALASEDGLTIKRMLDGFFGTVVDAKSGAKIRFGEKSPPHSFYAPWLGTLYPQAKVVTIIRNPIANIASMFLRYDERSTANLVKSTHRYMSFHHRKLDCLYDESGALVVRYEDLVENPDYILGRIYAYLNVDDSRIYKELVSNRRNYVSQSIDPKRVHGSTSILNDDHIRFIREKAAAIFDRYYPGHAA